MKCAGRILREAFKSGFRPCHSVFIGVGDIFRPGLFTCDHFEFKCWRGQLGRLAARPAAHRSHANTPYSWRIPPSRQGFNVLFSFIHEGRSVHLFQRVFGAVGGCLPVLAGVGGPLSLPTCFRFRHVNQTCVCVCVSVCVCLCVCVCECVTGHSGQG